MAAPKTTRRPSQKEAGDELFGGQLATAIGKAVLLGICPRVQGNGDLTPVRLRLEDWKKIAFSPEACKNAREEAQRFEDRVRATGGVSQETWDQPLAAAFATEVRRRRDLAKQKGLARKRAAPLAMARGFTL